MKKFLSVLLMVGIFAINFNFFAPSVAMAASLTAMSDTVGNLTTGVKASQIIKFTTPTGLASGNTVVLTFNNGTDTTGVIVSDIVITAPGAITLVAGAPGTTNWGFVNTSATVLTFTLGSTATVAASSVVTITLNGTNKIKNGSVGTTSLTVAAGSDTGVLSMAIITNGVVAVSASVLGSITFSVDQNSISFGTLSSSTARYANTTTGSASPTTAITISAGTNAPTGYSVSVQGDTLTSGVNTITPLAVSTASATGDEQFGINLVKSGPGALGIISAPYGTPSQYAYTATASTPVTIATANGATDTNAYAITYLANISALTEAGSYSTANTYVATGNF